MKVLIAEDDADQLSLRCLILAHQGYETVPASSVDSAFLAAQESRPAVAVIDICLPREADGLALIALLKGAFPDLRLIALTGGDTQRLRTLPEAKGVDEWIVKGNSAKRLMTVLKRLAAQRAA